MNIQVMEMEAAMGTHNQGFDRTAESLVAFLVKFSGAACRRSSLPLCG